LNLDVAEVAHHLDCLLVDDLAAPAGWASVAALFTVLGAHNMTSQLAVALVRRFRDPGRNENSPTRRETYFARVVVEDALPGTGEPLPSARPP